MAALGLLASVLLLQNLGNIYLWQDEAQTALIARTIASQGIPHGTDGRNFFSQELGVEYGDDYVWKWHTWLSFYAVAASFAVFGETTAAARLPFALFGIGTIVLCYFAGRALWRDRAAAAAGALVLALSVTFLLLSRQARWYSIAAFFTLLSLHAYVRMGRGSCGPAWTLFASATLLFHTHYFYCATVLASLLLHAALLERAKLLPVIRVAAAVTAVNLPWIAWFATIRYGESYAERIASMNWTLRFTRHFFWLFGKYALHWLWVVIPLGLAAERLLRRRPLLADVPRETWSHLALLALTVCVTIITLAFVTPGGFLRYLTPLLPCAALAAGLVLGAVRRRSTVLAAAALVAWMLTSPAPLSRFLHELTHDFDGPIEGIVLFLRQHAQPGDVVGITYGDLPLKFYTGLRVVGGLTGEDVDEARDAQWIIPRRSAMTKEEQRVRAALLSYLSPERYQAMTIDYPDTTFQNRETPRAHRYRTASRDWPRVVIYGKRR